MYSYMHSIKKDTAAVENKILYNIFLVFKKKVVRKWTNVSICGGRGGGDNLSEIIYLLIDKYHIFMENLLVIQERLQVYRYLLSFLNEGQQFCHHFRRKRE